MAGSGIFGHKSMLERRLYRDYEKLAEAVDRCRGLGHEKVVFTGGVWDLIHAGHLYYLEKAAEQGDLLVVGVDTDELANRRKKKNEINRPIIGFEERALVLAFLRSVDLITVVTDDIYPILEAIKADILVVSETTGDLPPDKYGKYEKLVKKIVPLAPQAPPDSVSSTARIRRLVFESMDISESALMERVAASMDAAKAQILGGVQETFTELKRDIV